MTPGPHLPLPNEFRHCVQFKDNHPFMPMSSLVPSDSLSSAPFLAMTQNPTAKLEMLEEFHKYQWPNPGSLHAAHGEQ